jgi:hypothetical protein
MEKKENAMTTQHERAHEIITARQDRQRDASGRWMPGCSAGPGRAPRAVETKYLAALSNRLTMDKWLAIIDAAIEAASHGDSKAREWLSAYAIGRANAAPPGTLDQLLDRAYATQGIALDNAGNEEMPPVPGGDKESTAG